MRTYTITSETGETAQITSAQVSEFREFYIGDSPLAQRMSELMWVDLYALDLFSGIDPSQVLDAVREVDAGDQSSTGTKKATRFNRLPLKGLWHKHYFSAHFLLDNIRIGLPPNKLSALVDDALNPEKGPVVTPEMIRELANRSVHEPIEERSEAKRLTGEWIVYLPLEGTNYFLCCGTHKSGDQELYDRIVEHCVRDFPDLPSWIAAARET